VHPLLWQKDLIEYCREKNIVVEAYSPIGKGDKRVTEDGHLIDLGKKYNKSVAQICLRWVLQHGFATIPRSKNPEHIR
jgi:diketogulonate reductase-like aldo/keto reductase